MCPFAPSTRATAPAPPTSSPPTTRRDGAGAWPAGTCFGCGQNMTDVAAAHGTANSSSDRSETTTPVSASARTTRLPPQSATSARGRDKAPCRAEYEDDDSATDVAVEPQGSRMVRRTAWTSSAASSPASAAAAPGAGSGAGGALGSCARQKPSSNMVNLVQPTAGQPRARRWFAQKLLRPRATCWQSSTWHALPPPWHTQKRLPQCADLVQLGAWQRRPPPWLMQNLRWPPDEPWAHLVQPGYSQRWGPYACAAQ
mmetsp:Transcript_31260/g.108051  ORF Transcript_31260/g.108051 Transcript_31260/m.108051 type:complete len:256 (-) Transcript_31260:130-897(-)